MTRAAVFGSGVVVGALLAIMWVYRRNRIPPTPLPEHVQDRHSMTSYFAAQKHHLEQAVRFEPFAELFSSLHELYRVSLDCVPTDNFFGQFVLMAHQGFLAAAGLIGQAQPDDAAPITRRTIEMVRVAAAIKEDRTNAEKWVAFETRHRRWLARQKGDKPPRLEIVLKVEHPIVNQLMDQYGILSDAGVHFTPEYFATLDWRTEPGLRKLNYFTGNQQTIEREILLLTGTHLLILGVLNDSVEGAFSRDERWRALTVALREKGLKYGARYQSAYGVAAPEIQSPRAPEA